MGLYAVTFLIALPFALVLMLLPLSVTKTLLFYLIVFVGSSILAFFVFRWVVKKHVEPHVSISNTFLQSHGDRFSLRNPCLMGTVVYFVLNALGQVCIGPLDDWLTSQLSPAEHFLSNFILDGLIGFLPFVIAVKYAVLRPYRLRRLVPFLGLLIVLGFSTAVAIAAVQVKQEWAFRNHVYCESLKPGMTKAEVDAALEPLGLRYQTNWGREELHGPKIPQVAAFTWPSFETPEIEYELRLMLGYDSENRLVMIGLQGDDLFDYEPIECPLPFR